MAQEDGSLPANSFASIPLEISAKPLVRLIREFRPQVIVSYDENGGYPHPDHIRAHQITVESMAAAADPSRYPDAGQPWQISKFYYDRIFNKEKMTAVYHFLKEREPDSPLIARFEEMSTWLDREAPNLATTHLEVGEFFEQRDEALRSHASQVAPDSAFFFWPNHLQREAWPYEDYQLIESKVNAVPDGVDEEPDLFAGVEDEA